MRAGQELSEELMEAQHFLTGEVLRSVMSRQIAVGNTVWQVFGVGSWAPSHIQARRAGSRLMEALGRRD